MRDDNNSYANRKKILNRFQPVQEDEIVECGYESDSLFEKLRLIQGSCLVLNVLILIFSVIYYEMIYESVWHDYQHVILVTMHICSIFLTVQTTIRYKMQVRLLQMRQKLRKIEGIRSAGYTFAFLFEVVLGLLHPNILLHNITYFSFNSLNSVRTTHNLNDILVILSLLRVTLITLMVISVTGMLSNRNHRICLFHGFEMDSTVIIKILQQDYPFSVISFMGGVSIIMFAYAIRICERPLTDILGDQNFGHLTGTIWLTVVTMTTGK